MLSNLGDAGRAVTSMLEHPAAERFYNAVDSLGYVVRAKQAKTSANGKRKCNHDGQIITEMFEQAKNGTQRSGLRF
jgi:hypothetical protein